MCFPLNAGYGKMPGQNIALGYTSWDTAVQGWFDEEKDFQFGVGSRNCNPVDKYTQVKYFTHLIVYWHPLNMFKTIFVEKIGNILTSHLKPNN